MSDPITLKHSIAITPEAVDMLFNIAVEPAKIAYSSEVEQTTALTNAKIAFSELLDSYLRCAYKKGKKIGRKYPKETPPVL